MLVQIVAKNNIDNLLTLEDYQETELVLLYKLGEKRSLSRYIDKVKEKFPKIKIAKPVLFDDLTSLMHMCSKLKPRYLQFNDQRIPESMAALSGLDREQTSIIFFDSQTSKRIVFNKHEVNVHKRVTQMLDVSDYVQLAGGDIEMVNDSVFDRMIEDGTFDMIISDTYHWHQFSRLFVDPGIVVENETDPLQFTVKFKQVGSRQVKYFRQYVDHFVEKGYFKVIANSMDRVIYRFSDSTFKSFFKLSGSWLELVAYKGVKDLRMDDIDASVLFTWNRHIKNFENEIDLLAVKNGKLLMISCKDTKKVSKDYLNEIIVNSNSLGDDNVTKCLVTTSHMIHDSFFIRAKELEIHVIQYEDDFEEFKDKLKKIMKIS
jgi:hypothetical protein